MRTIWQIKTDIKHTKNLLQLKNERNQDHSWCSERIEKLENELDKAKTLEEISLKYDAKALKLIPEMIEALKLIDRMEDGGYLIFDRKPTQMMPGLHEAVLDALAFYRTHF